MSSSNNINADEEEPNEPFEDRFIRKNDGNRRKWEKLQNFRCI